MAKPISPGCASIVNFQDSLLHTLRGQIAKTSWSERVVEWLRDIRSRGLAAVSILCLAFYREMAMPRSFSHDNLIQKAFPYVPLAIAVLLVPRKFWVQVLLGFSLLTLLLQPRYLWSTRVAFAGRNLLSKLLAEIPSYEGAVHALLFFVLCGAVFLVAYLLFRSLFSYVRDQPHFLKLSFCLFVFWFLFALSASWLNGTLLIFFLLLLTCLSRAIVSYLLFSLNSPKERFTIGDTLWVLSFWTVEIPMWVPQPLQMRQQDGVDYFKLIQEISILVIVLCCWREIHFRIFSPAHFAVPDLYVLSFSKLQGNPELYFAAWTTILVKGLDFLVETLWIKAMFFYFLLKALGYPMPRPFRNPLLAFSFYDFFSRMYFYYNRALVLLLYYPLYGRLRSFGFSAAARKYLAIFIAVLSFTFIFHCLRDYWVFLPGRFQTSLGSYLKTMFIYSLVLSGVVLLSIVFERNRDRRRILKILISPIYFVVFCLLVFLGSGHFDTVSVKLQTIKILFTGAF